MNKQKVDERLVEIALNRLGREIETKRGTIPHWFLVGYHEAICDIIWDYTKTGLKSLDWEGYMKEQMNKGWVKIGTIPIKDIKLNHGGKKNEV